jgi:transposase
MIIFTLLSFHHFTYIYLVSQHKLNLSHTKRLIREQKLVPVIKPNRRNTKEPIAIARMYRWFDKKLYKERYKVERTFGWQDTYRRLAISYDRLEETRLGFRHLAYAMINFRITFNSS